MIDSFQALTELSEETLTRLHGRLEAEAADHNLLDVAYRTVETPVGELLLAATPQGLVRIAYASEGLGTVLQSLAIKISPRILRAPQRLDAAASQLDDYFAGHRRSFQLPLDLRLSTGFRRSVLDHLRSIAYGTTESYATVAAATGHATAVRAVGSACATNPLPVVVPCHRVLRSDGSLGGYLGGLAAKRTLLDLEAAA
jgi:methylated-DNA-[protein]-cysteine S-methyltransferase